MPRTAAPNASRHPCDRAGCDKSYATPALLRDHKRLHDNLAAFQCPTCKKNHSSAVNLNGCKKKHETTGRFDCDYLGCDKSFARNSLLRDHKLLHEDPTAFACDTCGRLRFSSVGKADCERCDVQGCHRDFQTMTELSYHKVRHTGAKDFKCNHGDCDKAYAIARDLHAHEVTKHGSGFPKDCKACKLTCSSIFALDEHMREEHMDNALYFDLDNEKVVDILNGIVKSAKTKYGKDLVRAAVHPDTDLTSMSAELREKHRCFWKDVVKSLVAANIYVMWDVKAQIRGYYDPTKAEGVNIITISGIQYDELRDLVSQSGWHCHEISQQFQVSHAVVGAWYRRFAPGIAEDFGMTPAALVALARTRIFETVILQ